MEFILTDPLRWTPEEIYGRNSFFESSYSNYIMQRLLEIHDGFHIFTVSEVDPDCCTCFCERYTQKRANAEALARQCSRCWGGIDEILVIMGVKLMLEGKEYVLGETMLLRKLAAAQNGLPTNFVCWSHQLTFLPAPANPTGPIESPNPSGLCSQLFFNHRAAFAKLCQHLDWGDALEEEAAAAGPIPVFSETE
jgi:hypothetical protein